MYDLAPGHILQFAHIKRRFCHLSVTGKTFIEVGAGSGIYTKALLQAGLSGIAIDLNPDSCAANQKRNRRYVTDGNLEVKCGNFFELDDLPQADFLFSSMVIEHLEDKLELEYFNRCKELVRPKEGRIIVLVPSSMKHWGIEDEIAGHFRRYSFSDLQSKATQLDLKITNIVGLTYPLSNLILPLSNYLVRKSEAHKLSLSKQEQTELSGNRNVLLKSKFPPIAKVILNPITLFPFDLLQRAFRRNEDSMVIYCELQSG